MLRSLSFSKDGKLRTGLDQMEIAFALHDEKGELLWVDFTGDVIEEAEPVLQKTFGFHQLAIDDALQETHVPKVDDWGHYLYIVLHSVVFDPAEGGHVDTQELDIFLGPNYIVTLHEQPMSVVDHLWEAVQRTPAHLQQGPDHVLYRLTDEIAANFMPVVEQLDLSIDHIEAELFDHPTPDILARIFATKRAVLFLRRIIAPQREVLNKLARDDYAVIDEKDQIYFRDVYDHLVRMFDITEGVRDLVSGTLDTYLSVVNNRMNDIMKTLTIITTLFMPISFLSSFFGMNFFLPSRPVDMWTRGPIFLIILLIFLVTPISMFFWMRRRGWMGK
jgi:magnesium transporter